MRVMISAGRKKRWANKQSPATTRMMIGNISRFAALQADSEGWTMYWGETCWEGLGVKKQFGFSLFICNGIIF